MKKQSKSGSRPKARKSERKPAPFDWKNKPIVEFTELERKRWHDHIAVSLEGPMIEDARNGRGTLLVAAAVLALPNGEARLLHYGAEWGDGEGSALSEHTVAIAPQALLLGERVRLDLVEVQMANDGTCSCIVRTGEGARHEAVDGIVAPALAKDLDITRREVDEAEYWLAVLTTASGAKRIVVADRDGLCEARPQIAEFVLRARRMKWVKPGESIDRVQLKMRPVGPSAWTVDAAMDPVAAPRPRPR